MSYGKSLIELKVTELKNELDKRGLEKTGVKAILMERLEEAVKSEGHDITTYLFNVDEKVPSPNKPAPPKEDPEESQLKIVEENNEANQKPEDDDDDIQIVEEVNQKPTDRSKYNEEIQEGKKETKEPKEQKAQEIESPMKDEGPLTIDDDEVDYEEHEEPEIVEKETAKEARKEDESHEGQPESGDNAESKLVPSRNVESSNTNGNDENEEDEQDCNLWISNIPNTTKASDLKGLFLDYGKVTTAKIFTTRNNTSPACFGSVTMVDPNSAIAAQKGVNRTNWKGRIISVELVTNKQATRVPARKPIEPPAKSPPKDIRDDKGKEKAHTISKNGSKETKRAEIKPPGSKRAEIKPPEKSPPKGDSKPRRISESKPVKHESRRSPPRSNVRSRGGKSVPSRKDERSSNYRHSDRYNRRQEQPNGYSQRVHEDRRYRDVAYDDPRARYGYEEPRPRVFESEEVRRLLHEREVQHKKRELELEKERARAQIQLERERLEKERLAVEQLKLQVQLQAQQQAVAQNFGQFVPSLDSKTDKKDINSSRPRREDTRFNGRRRSRTPPRRSPPRKRNDNRRSRSPPAKRRDARDIKEKYNKYPPVKSSSSRAQLNHSSGYSDRRRSSPTGNVHSASGHDAYGISSSYSTINSTKRAADTTTIYNEKLANLGSAFAGGVSQQATSYSYQRSAATAPTPYDTRGQYYETGAPYQGTIHQFEAPETSSYETQLPGSWSRPRTEWDYPATANNTAEYKSYSRQY